MPLAGRGVVDSPGVVAKALAVHDAGKAVLDLAIAVALGGDCLADIGLARAEPGVFGCVASDPTVSRLINHTGRRRGKELPPDGCRWAW